MGEDEHLLGEPTYTSVHRKPGVRLEITSPDEFDELPKSSQITKYDNFEDLERDNEHLR